jgi:hypothetical protein
MSQRSLHIFFTPFLSIFCLLISNYSLSQIDTLKSAETQVASDRIKLPYMLVSRKDTMISRTDTTIVIREMIIHDKKEVFPVEVKTMKGGKEIMEIKDSIVTVSDTIIIKMDTVLSVNEKVLHDIEKFSKKKNILSRGLREILVFDKKEPPPPAQLGQPNQANPLAPSAQPYEIFNEKIIRNIDIRVLDVFGPSIVNPTRTPRNVLEKGGNFIHIKSQHWVIKNKLLFSRGDRLNSLKISESERLLRQSNYIYDARITVVEQAGSDSVDVIVTAQDVWSITPGVAIGGNSYGGGINEVNFLGLGQQLQSNVNVNPQLPGGYNYVGGYTINNIYKTLITANLFYTYQNGQRQFGYGLNRDFITSAIKWGGGFNMAFTKVPIYTILKDSTIKIEPLNYNTEDLWLGYAAKLLTHSESGRYKGDRLMFSGRVSRSEYIQRPAIGDTLQYYYSYYNTNFYLGSIGFINRRFYKDNYIFRFGRTEDITEGSMLAFTGGIQKRDIGSRPYFGVISAWSKFNKHYGYIYAGIGIGGYYDQNHWQQGVAYYKYLYFTPLMSLGNWKYRNFIGLRYSHGYNQIPGATVSISKDNGVRGFSANQLIGNQKLVINSEIDLFPPLNIVGFRMGFVIFADFAWISNKTKLIDKGNFFPGYGIGIRIRNDHLIFPTIQFLVGYYPNAPKINNLPYQFFNSQKFFYNFNDFQFSRPDVIPF